MNSIDSVRITSNKVYNGGLFVADIYAMAHGCAVWPAYWSVGPNWPNQGEIDIIGTSLRGIGISLFSFFLFFRSEGVNLNTVNQYTLHTSDGCTLDKTATSSLLSNATSKIAAFTSKVLGTQCASSDNSNAGCAFLESSTNSYGHGFNDLAGGVYATLVDDTGVSIWRF